MIRLPRVAAVIVTLAAAALATTAQGDAHAASAPTTPSATSSTAKPPHTHLILHVTGCDRCSIAPQHAVTGHQHVWTPPYQRIGSDHRAVFRVRTAWTRGMSFVLRAPWQGDTGAVPNVVTAYRGHAVDSYVSRASARNGRRAEGCWAGTTVDRVRLDFHVSRVRARTLDGHPTRIPLVYATHTMSSWQPMVKAFKGTIGNQDAFYCTQPPNTEVTFQTPGCNGCEIGIMNGAARIENTWAVAPKTVSGESVSFRVPRTLTRGISATVLGPWEGATGYTTMLVWRYAGHRVGDAVSFHDARSQTRGTPCWGGTTSKALTIPLTIRKVTVPGTTGPAAGTIAFADVTQTWVRPMMRAGKGVVGSQEVITCRK
jgi:hypothetical protein